MLLHDFFKISRDLEEHHVLFYKLWELGRPRFCDEIETACIKFDRNGECLEFLFNEKFWNSIDNYTRIFVIAHELLHVILDHGTRTKDSKNQYRTNVALDLVVNHLLVNSFGFEREKINGQEKLCWTDTVFNYYVTDDECYEYYVQLLENQPPPNLVFYDLHSFLEKNELRKILDKLNLSLEEVDEIRGSFGGDGALILKAKYTPKKKWESVIKEWVKKKLSLLDQDQWTRKNRRFSLLKDDLFLPTDNEYEFEDKDKIDLWLFQDTSGSCRGLASRFFAAAKSIPKDKFNIKLFCFDTKIYETSLESGKLYGFGGTYFSIIERYIQANSVKYPAAIFVVTDGYGDRVSPKYPKNWHVFLSSKHASCFPKECNIYQLSDFE